MNFDELKKQWDKQPADNVEIKEDLNKLSSLHDMMNQFLKESKYGFISRIISLVYLLIFPLLFKSSSLHEVVYVLYFLFAFQLIISSIVVLRRFHHFSSVAKVYEVNSSYRSLLYLYYEFKYYIETSKYLTLVDTPSFIGFIFIMICRNNSLDYLLQLLHPVTTWQSNPLFFIWLGIGLLFIVLFMCYLFYYAYPKAYNEKLKRVKEVLDELES